METSPRSQERAYPSTPPLLPSPTSHSSSSSSATATTTSAAANGAAHHHQQPPLTRSEANPYPTTFVQADTSSFKQVVQMLTGSSETIKVQAQTPTQAQTQPKPANSIPPIKTPIKSKLYERRNSLKNLRINPLVSSGYGSNHPTTTGFSPRSSDILSPSLLDFPSLVLSPVTPLIPDPFNRSPNIIVDRVAEEKAIAAKGFFLHPSPVSTPRDSEPRLLPLFPVTSPRVSGSSDPSP